MCFLSLVISVRPSRGSFHIVDSAVGGSAGHSLIASVFRHSMRTTGSHALMQAASFGTVCFSAHGRYPLFRTHRNAWCESRREGTNLFCCLVVTARAAQWLLTMGRVRPCTCPFVCCDHQPPRNSPDAATNAMAMIYLDKTGDSVYRMSGPLHRNYRCYTTGNALLCFLFVAICLVLRSGRRYLH